MPEVVYQDKERAKKNAGKNRFTKRLAKIVVPLGLTIFTVNEGYYDDMRNFLFGQDSMEHTDAQEQTSDLPIFAEPIRHDPDKEYFNTTFGNRAHIDCEVTEHEVETGDRLYDLTIASSQKSIVPSGDIYTAAVRANEQAGANPSKIYEGDKLVLLGNCVLSSAIRYPDDYPAHFFRSFQSLGYTITVDFETNQTLSCRPAHTCEDYGITP